MSSVEPQSQARALGVPLHATSVGDWFARSDGALGGVVQRFQAVWDAAMVDARAGGALLLIDEVDSIPDRATLSDRAVKAGETRRPLFFVGAPSPSMCPRPAFCRYRQSFACP